MNTPAPVAKILLQLDTDAQPSVFDSVVAIDAGVDQLLRHGAVEASQVASLVHGLLFTRAPDVLHHSAVFIGGNSATAAEQLLAAVRGTFFGPFSVSVLLDPSGANTTAAAAVLAAAAHGALAGRSVAVLGATGAVGQRVVRLLARAGAVVHVGSRDVKRSGNICDQVRQLVPDARLEPCAAATPEARLAMCHEAEIVVAAGAAGCELLPAEALAALPNLRVAIDLNAVPPQGIAAVEVTDKATQRNGASDPVICYGALGVGGTKMKIHKAAIRALFERRDQVLDAEQLYELGQTLTSGSAK